MVETAFHRRGIRGGKPCKAIRHKGQQTRRKVHQSGTKSGNRQGNDGCRIQRKILFPHGKKRIIKRFKQYSDHIKKIKKT